MARVVKKILSERAPADKFDVCICDGVRINDAKCKTLRAVLDGRLVGAVDSRTEDSVIDKKFFKLIFVFSLQIRISPGKETKGDHGVVQEMAFDSWQEEDYDKAAASALMDDEPTKAILLRDWPMAAKVLGTRTRKRNDRKRVLQVVKMKFHYAGGCPRYMFEMDVQALLSSLDVGFEAVEDPIVFTKTGLAGKANSLMQQFSIEGGTTMCTAVSKYVLLLAYKECRAKLTKAVRAVAEATSNPTLKGWAFELSQLDIIRSALEANGTTASRAVKNNKLTFSPMAEVNFDGSTLDGNVKSGSVIWCSKYNQALYDVAFFWEKTLVTLQFTRAAKHSLKLVQMRHLRNAIIKQKTEIEFIVHLGVVEENVGAFSFGKVDNSTAAATFEVLVDKSTVLENKISEADEVVTNHAVAYTVAH
jgi:hypothetical protein